MARIALCANPENVAPEVLDRIAEAADLPAGEICLLVGDPSLEDAYHALSVPRVFVRSYGSIAGLEDHLDKAWDCGVIVGSKWAIRQPEYPAYFAYLLGHEFGHAKTVLTQLWLAAYEGLIFDVVGVSDREGWRWDEFPHEIRYDQFGLAVAEATYGMAELRDEVRRLLESGLENDEERPRRLMTLAPRLGLDGLRTDLAEFALPYKDALIAKWTHDIQGGSPGLARYLRDLGALWRAI